MCVCIQVIYVCSTYIYKHTNIWLRERDHERMEWGLCGRGWREERKGENIVIFSFQNTKIKNYFRTVYLFVLSQRAVQMWKPHLPCTCRSTAVALNCTPCPTNKKTASHWIRAQQQNNSWQITWLLELGSTVVVCWNNRHSSASSQTKKPLFEGLHTQVTSGRD